MKLGKRIMVSFILSVLVSVMLFVVVSFLTWSIASWGRYSDDDLILAAQYLADRARTEPDYAGDPRLGQALMADATRRFPGISFELVAADLTIQASSRGLSGQADLAGVIQYPHHFKQEWVQAEAVHTIAGLQGYALASVSEAYRKVIDVHSGHAGAVLAGFLVAMGIGITLAVAGLAAWILSRTTARRFNRLYRAFSSLNLNNLEGRLTDGTKDELGELAAIFNFTAAKLQLQAAERQTMHENLKLLLSEVAHDLRTPLSIITGHAEQIGTGVVGDAAEIMASIGRIRSHSRYMSDLLDGLTDFAAAESGNLSGVIAPFDIAEACRIAIIDLLPVIENRRLEIEPELPDEPVWALGNEQWFRRAFTNILDNAIHHGGVDGPIEIRLEPRGAAIRVLIRDHGPGIPQSEVERVFEPFYRPDRSRNSRIGGLGLGLHIARKILRHSGGELRLLSSLPGNTVFSLELPMAAPKIAGGLTVKAETNHPGKLQPRERRQ